MRIGIILGFLILSSVLHGQTFNGLYTSNFNLEKIEFLPDNGIKFQFHVTNGLGLTAVCGNGTYKYHRNKLIINVKSHDTSLESKLSIVKDSSINSGFILKGHVTAENGEIISGANFRFKVGKKYCGFLSDKNGYFEYKFDNRPDSKIEICLIGCSSTFIDYMDKTFIECNIILKESQYRFIDGKTMTVYITLDTINKTFNYKGFKTK